MVCSVGIFMLGRRALVSRHPGRGHTPSDQTPLTGETDIRDTDNGRKGLESG